LDQQKLLASATTAFQKPGYLKVVGSGHSFSDILDTEGLLLYRSHRRFKDKKKIVWAVNRKYIKKEAEPCLVHVAAWAKIWEINKALRKQGFAFSNLGSAVLQTYAGVISTSTHGSGVQFPPLCDDVRSILLLKADGTLCRIESSKGITLRETYEPDHPDVTLIQDDKTFYSALVSMGCMGVVLEYISCAQDRFKLEEIRRLTTWRQLRKELAENPARYFNERHFDIILNPYKNRGENSCIVTIRRMVDPTTSSTPYLGKFLKWAVVKLQKVIGKFLKNTPRFIPRFLELSITSLVRKDSYIDESTEIFDLDLINKVVAVSAEYVFPMKNNGYLDAIDALINQVEINCKKDLYHNTPFGIRFVKKSNAYLSMMYEQDSCTIETALLSGTDGWRVMLNSYEAVCMKHSGRPHWGQYHETTGGSWFRRNYPCSEQWLQVRQQMDPEGVFRNRFTRRMGF
jgi:L-gulonolactone oxidase